HPQRSTRFARRPLGWPRRGRRRPSLGPNLQRATRSPRRPLGWPRRGRRRLSLGPNPSALRAPRGALWAGRAADGAGCRWGPTPALYALRAAPLGLAAPQTARLSLGTQPSVLRASRDALTGLPRRTRRGALIAPLSHCPTAPLPHCHSQ